MHQQQIANHRISGGIHGMGPPNPPRALQNLVVLHGTPRRSLSSAELSLHPPNFGRYFGRLET